MAERSPIHLAVAGKFSGGTDDGHAIEAEWDLSLSRATKNPNGVTGWGRILQSTSPTLEVGKLLRLHLCAHKGCQARHKHESKYGIYGQPVHLQPTLKFERKRVLSVETKVALCSAPSTVAVQTEEVKPIQTAVAVAHGSMPQEPHRACLKLVEAAVAATEVASKTTQPSLALQVPAVVIPEAVEANILGRLLSLAREIRRPRQYVGYSFFILFALVKRCRPFIWEGDSRIDVIQSFLPWAQETCVQECCVDAVCCCFEVIDHAQARMVPVSECHPLHETRHYVAAKQIHMNDASTGDDIQSYYQRFGVVLLGTVMDGDCGVDCACQMLGLPTSREARNQLRQDLHFLNYLIASRIPSGLVYVSGLYGYWPHPSPLVLLFLVFDCGASSDGVPMPPGAAIIKE